MPKAQYLPPHPIFMHCPPPSLLHHSIVLGEEVFREAGAAHVIGIARLKLMWALTRVSSDYQL